MKKIIVYASIFLIGGAGLLNGCKKDKPTPEIQDTDTQAVQDNSLADGSFNDVDNIASQAVDSGSLSTYRLRNTGANLLSACATLDIHDTSGHGVIYVDFGSTPCLCADYRYRKGIINISYTGHYRDSGSVISITFNNYYVGRTQTNMYKVTGTKTVSNKGHNTAGHIWFDINVNGNLLNTSGQTMTWISSRQREWIAGAGTPVWLDDEYMITGSANGTSFNGTSYTLSITQALHVDLSCRWIRDGKFDFTPGARATRHFDYGSGNCDNNATVTINN